MAASALCLKVARRMFVAFPDPAQQLSTMHSLITPRWMIEQGFSGSFARRFWKRVQITDTCWVWVGAKNEKGYGKINQGPVGGHSKRAHVVSWMLHRGPIPEGLCVCHNCPGGDNPACVNPNHLWTGTNYQNRRDSVLKGTNNRGSKNGSSKLTESIVLDIRRRAASGEKQRLIAHDLKMSESTISSIVHRVRWSWLKDSSVDRTASAALPEQTISIPENGRTL